MKTLRNPNLILLLLFSIPVLTYSQGWQWAKGIGGSLIDNNYNIIANNNIYSSGVFSSPICYFDTDTFNLRGDEDIFLVKYNLSGIEQWVKQLGSYNHGLYLENIYSMITDPISEDLYITGKFKNNIIIDTILITGNQKDVFIAKYDSNGILKWIKTAGGSGDDAGTSLAIDSIGNIYLSANCKDTAAFGIYTVPPGNILAKYDTAGNCIWAKRIMKNIGVGINYNNGNLIMAGNSVLNSDSLFVDSINFIPSNGSVDIIVAKFDTTGKLMWVHKEGGDSADFCSGSSCDEFGNVYICGDFADSTVIQNDTLTQFHSFIAKYSNTGANIWVKDFGTSPINSASHALRLDSENNIYIGGFFRSNITFDNITLNPQSVADAFIVKYSPSGNCLGADQLFNSEALDLAIDINNNPIMCGSFGSQITTSSGTILSHGQDDGCIVMHDAITSINETERKKGNQLLIYSNPTTGKCNITIPDEWSNGNHDLTLNLYDGHGAIIQSYPVSIKDGAIKLDIEKEAKGIYIVSLTDGKKVYNGRIVFQ